MAVTSPWNDDSLKKANWLTDRAVSTMLDVAGLTSIREFLSPAEKIRVEERWLEIHEPEPCDAATLESRLGAQLQELGQIGTSTYLPWIVARVRRLLEIVRSRVKHFEWAASALAYVADRQDVIPDTIPYVGLVDDIHVVETAFGMFDEGGAWRPELERLLRLYPYIERLSFAVDGRVLRLSDYLKLGIVLSANGLDRKERRLALVVPEVGPLPFLTALVSCIGANRGLVATIDVRSGDVVQGTLGGGEVFGTYRGTVVETDGRRLKYVESEDGTRVGLTEERFLLLRKCTLSPPRLSRTAKWLTWAAECSSSPLRNVVDVAAGRRVLLFSTRLAAERFAATYLPGGESIAALVGLRYVTATGRWEDFRGSSGVDPLLWVCSHAATASDTVLEGSRPEAVGPQVLVVDAAHSVGEVEALLSSAREAPALSVVTFAAAWDIDRIQALRRLDFEVCYIQPGDVDHVPGGTPSGDRAPNAGLETFQRRQWLRPTFKIETDEVRDDVTEALQGRLDRLRRLGTHSAGDPVWQAAMLLGRDVLQRIHSNILPHSDSQQRAIRERAERLARYCAKVAPYDHEFAEMADTARRISQGALPGGARLDRIRERVAAATEQRITILCASRAAAEEHRIRSQTDAILRRVTWQSFEDYQLDGEADLLLAAGWSRSSQMRRLLDAPQADRTVLVCYPFEIEWEKRSRQVRNRWHLGLYRSTDAYWRSSGRSSEKTTPSPAQKYLATALASGTGSADASGSQSSTSTADQTVFDELDDIERTIVSTRMQAYRATTEGHEDHSVAARLIFFDDDEGRYAYLPASGRVICLSGILLHGLPSAEQVAKSAESLEGMLYKNVASLEVGDILVLPESGVRDLLDSIADRLMPSPATTRANARLWRDALRRFQTNHAASLQDIQERLAREGVRRTRQTIRSWIHDSNLVAPHHWNRGAIDGILRVTSDAELGGRMNRVMGAIAEVYDKRRQAAEKVIEELRRGRIDPGAGRLSIDLHGDLTQYMLLPIRTVAQVENVPSRLVGVLAMLRDLRPDEGELFRLGVRE